MGNERVDDIPLLPDRFFSRYAKDWALFFAQRVRYHPSKSDLYCFEKF
jgi:hypothetical protein